MAGVTAHFDPPPGWPPPPPGWTPTPGWRPDPSWPQAPTNWRFFVEDTGCTPADAAALNAGLRTSPTEVDAIATSPSHPAAGSRRHVTPSRFFGWGAAMLFALLGLTSGIGGVLVMIGIYALMVAVVAIIRGRLGWAHLPSRTAGVVALVASVVAVGAGGALLPVRPGPVSADLPMSTPTPSAPATSIIGTASSAPSPTTPDPATDAIAKASAGSALAALGTLGIQTQVSPGGYTRAAFGQAWADTDHNGCDQRNDILRRDLTAVTLQHDTHGCVVVTGVLADPYTGEQVAFERTSSNISPVEIDHVVALGDAWSKGASGWDGTTRLQLANDALNLLSVSAAANVAKGDSDAAAWMPPAHDFACPYVARQIAVKAKYRLSVTSVERAAMSSVLAGCPSTPIPNASFPALGGFPDDNPPAPPQPVAPPTPAMPAPTSSPAPGPAPVPPVAPPSINTPAPVQGVHPGAFCSPTGAIGHTSAGTLMVCRPSATDTRARWRSG